MKWILIVTFLVFKSFAEPSLAELPVDVQNDIKSTEGAISLVSAATETRREIKSEPAKKTGKAIHTETAKVSGKESENESGNTTTNNNTTNLTDSRIDNTAEKSALDSSKEVLANSPENLNDQNAPKSQNLASVKEAEIPLSLETTKKVVAGESSFSRIIMVIALLGILVCGTWIFVRKNKFQNIRRNKNEIKILAQHYLGPKKSLAVVRVAGESILVGITDSQINMIKSLALMDDELPEVTGHNFRSELDERLNAIDEKVTSNMPSDVSNQGRSNGVANAKVSTTYNRNSRVTPKAQPSGDDVDEFSIRGIKDLVSSKLKNMRSI